MRFETKSKPIPKPPDKPIDLTGKSKAEEEPQPPKDEFTHLRDHWRHDYADIMNGTKEELPPWREVNHEIHLIDPNKQYHYYLPRCPNSLREEFHEKINQYVNAGWWEPRAVSKAAPMLCIRKKDAKLRTVVDARQRNDNMVKDVTPLPDQEIIREDVARAKFRSKIDLSDAYEQVRIQLDDVDKTAFATISGTYRSMVMQQGDCNAPATFQRLLTAIFRDVIGKFMHVYLDDIFIYSDTVEDHERHLKLVLDRLRENTLYLKWSKCNLYAKTMDCLGHVIDDRGIHPDSDKMSLNGGYMPSMIKDFRSDNLIPKGISSFANQALQNLADAHDAIIEARVFQTHRANLHRQSEPKISMGDLVYLLTKNLNLPKGRATKLCPKFVGPYKVLKTNQKPQHTHWNYRRHYNNRGLSLCFTYHY